MNMFQNYKIIRRFLFITILIGFVSCKQLNEPREPTLDNSSKFVAGKVGDESGPISGAIVRIKTTQVNTTTDALGNFKLNLINSSDSVVLTAWASGYYIGGGESYFPGDTTILLTMHKHNIIDNPDYSWVSAQSKFGNSSNCQNCHAASGSYNASLPYDEWISDAHGQSARNIRFLTMYKGTDIYGSKSPDTRFGYNRDYGRFPLLPVYDDTYFGPGYKLDFPNTAGNCAACHTPMAAIDDAYETDPTILNDAEKEGIGCDFCHKIWDVKINQSTGMPYDNMPGVSSYEFRRPPEGHQFFAGPLDDVAPGEDTYSPVQKESKYCAPCHTAKFWGVTIYNSYGEWLESSYSNPETGKTCQVCHMPAGLADHFVSPEKGGLIRNPETIVSHLMPGAMDEELLRNAVTLTAESSINGTELVVKVRIVNDKTGHHVPTDSPMRHLILLITATNSFGDTLEQISGGTLPKWCGVGNPALGYYSGLPGKTFAKILKEMWTGISPTGAYWNMTTLESDNRIAAFASDVSEYKFNYTGDEPVTINVKLFYRRAFRNISDWKGWNDPDILMAEEILTPSR